MTMPAKKLDQAPGTMTATLSDLLAERRQDGDWTSKHEALASVAQMLAQTLDDGAGLATAGITKEYRQVLEALTEVDDAGDSFDAIVAELSAAMGDQATP